MLIVDNCPLCDKPMFATQILVSQEQDSQSYHSKCFTAWVIENRK